MTAQNHLNLQQGARTPPSFGLAELLWLQTQQMAAAHGQGFFLEKESWSEALAGQELTV